MAKNPVCRLSSRCVLNNSFGSCCPDSVAGRGGSSRRCMCLPRASRHQRRVYFIAFQSAVKCDGEAPRKLLAFGFLPDVPRRARRDDNLHPDSSRAPSSSHSHSRCTSCACFALPRIVELLYPRAADGIFLARSGFIFLYIQQVMLAGGNEPPARGATRE